MNRFVKLMIAPVVALVGMFVMTSPSEAALKLYAQQAGINGGNITEIASGADFDVVFFNNTYGSFTLNGLVGSSSNGATLSDLLQSTVRVTNNTGTAATINIYVSQDGYTLPAGSPLIATSSLGGTITTGTLNLDNIYQAFADNANAQLGMGGFTNGPQDATLDDTSFDTGAAVGIFDRDLVNPAYSLTTCVTLDLSGGGIVNYASTLSVTQAVPAPAGLVLVLGAMPVFGIGAYIRRRRAPATV